MRSLLALPLLLAIGACGPGEAPEPPEPPPAAADPMPEPAPLVEVPEGDLRGDASAGAKTYQLYCATCHGAQGKGDGIAAPKNPPPADHTDAAYMGKLDDAYLYRVIQRGGAAVGKSPLMAPWGGVLADEQIRDVIAHLRTLSGT